MCAKSVFSVRFILRLTATWGTLGLLLTASVACNGDRHAPGSSSVRPRVTHVDTIDVGARDVNKTSRVLFDVQNTGDQPLIITRVETPCACQSVFVAETSRAAVDLSVEPGNSVRLGIDFVVGGNLNEVSKLQLKFHTNDPDRPVSILNIAFTPSSSIYVIPSGIVHQQAKPDELPQFKVDVYADGRSPLVTSAPIQTDLPEDYSVQFLASPGAQEKLGNSGAVKIGCLVINSLKPIGSVGERSVTLTLIQNGKAILSLPISVSVSKEYIVLPSAITLPRRTSEGYLYEAMVMCKRTDNKPFEIEVSQIGQGLDVQPLVTEAGKNARTLNVKLERTKRASLRNVSFHLRF